MTFLINVTKICLRVAVQEVCIPACFVEHCALIFMAVCLCTYALAEWAVELIIQSFKSQNFFSEVSDVLLQIGTLFLIS